MQWNRKRVGREKGRGVQAVYTLAYEACEFSCSPSSSGGSRYTLEKSSSSVENIRQWPDRQVGLRD